MPRKNYLNIPVLIAFLVDVISSFIPIFIAIDDTQNIIQIQRIALFVIVGLYPIRYLLKKPKVLLDHIKLALILLWSINQFISLYGLEFNNTLYITQLIVQFIVLILFAIWLFMEGIDYFSKDKISDGKKFKRRLIQKNLFASAALLVTLGAVFTISHYPGGRLFIYIGLGVSILWFFFDYIFKPKK